LQHKAKEVKADEHKAKEVKADAIKKQSEGAADLAGQHQHHVEKKLTEALVQAVYTYGAPATRWPPFRNAATEDGCFAGLRSYTEESAMWGTMTSVDAAPGNNWKPHMVTNTLVLKWQEDSIYSPCNGPDHGHSDWPTRGISIMWDWALHKEPIYKDRYEALTINGTDMTHVEPFNQARLFVTFAWRAYESLPMVHEALAKLPEWRLVAREVYENAVDSDPVLVIQDVKTLGCVLAFTGTDYIAEVGTSLQRYGTGYCGYDGVHAGYRNELWTLTNTIWGGIRPKLEKCANVTCVGHSLGGALCEIFSACANSGNFTDPDYHMLAWNKTTPILMPEVDA